MSADAAGEATGAAPVPRPVPELTPYNRAFWTAGARNELRIQHCPACRRWLHPPRALCPGCLSADLEYPPVSGRGEVYTFSVLRHAYRAGLELPYVVALVELPEQAGLRVTSNIVGCEAADVYIGLPVTVEFERAGDEVWIPLFRPVTGG